MTFRAQLPTSSAKINGADIDKALHHHFGLESFRPLQREVIECVLAGESALAVLPTGGGKSLCYQLPALLLPGVAIVVSPLISLMKDQVDALTSLGVAAVSINSHDTPAEIRQKLTALQAGKVKLVYVAPERLKSAGFLSTCRQAQISLLAVDEAHCVSQWGHDFRPDYRLIHSFRQEIGNPPLLALTATATRRVKEDIMTHLGIEGARRFEASVDRPNLWLGIERCATVAEKRGMVVAHAALSTGSTIVYVSSRRDADEYASLLEEQLNEPVASYHAGLPPDTRTSVQNRFMAGMVRIVTATNAFGMGIDKADIRSVIHAGVPESIEAYFQEIGRAGRDGEPSQCTMIVVPGMDIRTRQYLLEKDTISNEHLDAFYDQILRMTSMGEGIVPLGEKSEASLLVLSYLQALDVLELTQRTPEGMYVRFKSEFPFDGKDQVRHLVQSHTKAKLGQFRQMRSFVYLTTCRRDHLLRYFGEAFDQAPEDCCSACSPRPVEARSLPKPKSQGRTGPSSRSSSSSHLRAAPSSGRTRSEPTDFTHADPELLERLKAWRREQARMRQVPAYVIFGDKDLAGIAAAVPRDHDDLASCKGVGPTKLKLYGDDILEIVWQTVSHWVANAPDVQWKPVVRRLLHPTTYLAVRNEIRRRSTEATDQVAAELSRKHSPRDVELTLAVMRRVKEL